MASEKNITMRQYNGVDYDTLYPKTIAEQVIGIYSKDEILSNATKTIYGLGADAVPDDVLALLGPYTNYWWKKQQLDMSVVLGTQKNVQHLFSSELTVYYSSEIVYVSRDTAELKNPESIKITSGGATEINENVKGKYFYTTYNNILYFMPLTASASLDASSNLIIPAQEVTIESTDVGDSVLMHSASRDAYPDSGIADGYEYAFLGKPLDNAIAAGKIETGSYVGTGTYGADNPCILTFDRIPKLVIIGKLTPSEYTGAWNGSFIWYSIISSQDVYAGSNRSTVQITQNQKSLEWYNKNYAANQLNTLGSIYPYIAIL